MKFSSAHILGLTVSFGVLVSATTSTMAQTPFYKGKRITMLINFAVGGGADIEGRLFAKYLAKHLEGQPTIVVQNMEGAGGLVGANFLGEVAPKDGTYIGYLSSAAGLHLTEAERWRADLRTYEFAAYVPGTAIVYVRTDVSPGIKEAKDLAQARGLILGGRSANSPNDIGARLALDILDMRYGYVTGYRSAATGRLALQRGEINVFSESPSGYRSAVEPQLVKTGQVVPLWYHLNDTSDLPPPRKEISGLDIASFPQLHKRIKGTLPAGKLWDVYQALFNVNWNLQRVLALPPGAPRAALEALQSALVAVSKDRNFEAEALKTIDFAPDLIATANSKEHVRAMLNVSPEIKQFINEYIKSAP